MIRIPNALCSWGVIENVSGERGGYVQVLDEKQQTGYAGTELGDWGFMPTDPQRLRQELESRSLGLLASWVSVALHDLQRPCAHPFGQGVGLPGVRQAPRPGRTGLKPHQKVCVPQTKYIGGQPK